MVNCEQRARENKINHIIIKCSNKYAYNILLLQYYKGRKNEIGTREERLLVRVGGRRVNSLEE